MPTKLKYKLLICFCLTSLLPMMVGVYIASLFIKFPFVVSRQNLIVVSLVSLFSLLLSYLGYIVTKQTMTPILDMTAAAQKIAAGKLEEEQEENETKGADELEDLSRSLRKISRNARELLDKVEKLTLRDKLTGLYNATYIRERLNEEIERAIYYQRPCSFAYFIIERLEEYGEKRGEAAVEEILKGIAKVFNGYMTELARAARIGRNEFVIILPDKNKKKAIEIIEKIVAEVSESFFPKNSDVKLSITVGISENPIDGVQADELYIKAQDRMKAAQTSGKELEAFV